MVQGIPYVHWKINGRENIDYDNVDVNYLWATVVEASKGPINVPVLCGSNNDVLNVFGVDLGAYFAQGAEYLIVVRAGAQSDTHPFGYASQSITNSEPFEYRKVVQPHYVVPETYEFASYADEQGEYQYATGTVKTTGKIDGGYSQVQVITNTPEFPDNPFINRKLFITSDAKAGSTYELYESESDDTKGALLPNLYVKITSHNASLDNGPKKYVIDEVNGDENDGYKVYVNTVPGNASLYKACDKETGVVDENVMTVYPANEVVEAKVAETVSIPTGTPLINLQAKHPGAYDIKLILMRNLTYKGYNLTLTEEGAGYVSINNVLHLQNIVNTINNAELSVVASLTEKGKEVVEIVSSTPVASEEPFSDVAVGQVLAREDGERYKVVLTPIEDTITFSNGSNGEWDNATGRISESYSVLAHREALATLQNIRLAGVFCLYGESDIQAEYLLHGTNKDDEYSGMNSNLVCKWRWILIGANAYDREDIWNLKEKAQAVDNQYVVFLGQGLIENNVQLLPYQCTPYIAGLRAKLNYGESIFGGQTRKRILSANDGVLKIAPLFQYEDEKTTLVWEPLVYQDLNEAGVLTFTTEYGGLTLLDGVTTAQETSKGETEEGVVNILKYIQNNVQTICLGYIGRNINTDSEAALKMNIKVFLETMVTQDQTLIDLPDEGLSAYEVDVVMAPRNGQTIGKIYVYLKVTPVHALRQIEVEMTVQ